MHALEIHNARVELVKPMDNAPFPREKKRLVDEDRETYYINKSENLVSSIRTIFVMTCTSSQKN